MTIKTTKKMTAVLCIALLLSGGLSGCRLAVPDKGDAASGDILIGAYITFESLDEPEFEMRGGKLTEKDGGPAATDGRIYAKTKTAVLYGHKTTMYEFPGIRGVALFDPGLAKKGDPINSCPQVGPEIMEQNVAVTNSDTEKLSGTIYVATSGKQAILFLNPVHMTANGKVYLTAGTGCSTSSDGLVGQAMSETISETASSSFGSRNTDNKKSFTMTVEVNMKFANAPDEIIFKQMSVTDKIIAVTKVTAKSIPAVITRKPDTAYIIVENHGVNSKNKPEITREILNNGTDFYICKFFNKLGVAVGKSITIK